MQKNIVLCCDGTANEFKADRTNVIKLAQAMVKDPDRQLVYYHPGIGTMAPPGFATRLGALVARSAGMAFGYGLTRDVADAYVFLMNHYQAGDRVYLFGFSRGAYTARVVSAMLHLYGLALPGNEALVPYAVRMLWAITRHRGNEGRTRRYFALAEEFKATLAGCECPTHFLGVFDTVSSVGWVGSPVAIPFTRDNPSVGIVRHAVSIDERRAFFRTNLFAPRADGSVREVWFPGVHCDVGGGYPEGENGLSTLSLAWMAQEAVNAGLLVDDARLPKVSNPGAAAPRHESLTWPWWPAEFVPKRHWDRERRRPEWRANLFRRRTLGPAPCVHDAAWEPTAGDPARLPGDAVRLSEKVWP